ncbi:MAG: DUF2344 domain-containing protein [Clostridia bacterium]|nr:DUF2344 domain-containing protein [Clostridia bacterium]
MLSQGEKLKEKARLRAMPLLEPPVTVRLKFRKVGSLQYISHLDLQRTFQRVLTRACLPIWYTKGFNPHPKMVFSTPLSVGAQSEYEFLDLRIDRDMSPREIMDRLNRELTEELRITDAYLPTSDFSEIAWATYEIRLHTRGGSDALAASITARLSGDPLTVVKKTKAGEREIDILPLIRELNATWDAENEETVLCAVLRASAAEFLNPELLMTALKRECGILCGDPSKEWYSILRTAVLKEDLSLFS